MDQEEPREAIFISHASPEQNMFTLWLGAKLAAMGYEVWADVLRLKGGDDWQRKLEQAQAVVTENNADFPEAVLTPLNIEARTADEFIADTIALDEGKAVAAIRTLRTRLTRPEMSAEGYLRSLEAHGLFVTASLLNNHIESI
ncbi:toll/interleukin-1 receptor domain-containing protein [Novosphingobium sp. ES2-1]|uniref:toll/interleukin-1 receptor domain-containing protein n=1 Tax=Novosphingobium sp. ES2-1 TaxID=2780074 RepID=UPI001E42A971|nr:toll/interleukin-1 receptor domain-containing protein [Novosphingobium sp. ES2-1]